MRNIVFDVRLKHGFVCKYVRCMLSIAASYPEKKLNNKLYNIHNVLNSAAVSKTHNVRPSVSMSCLALQPLTQKKNFVAENLITYLIRWF